MFSFRLHVQRGLRKLLVFQSGLRFDFGPGKTSCRGLARSDFVRNCDFIIFRLTDLQEAPNVRSQEGVATSLLLDQTQALGMLPLVGCRVREARGTTESAWV